LEGRLVDAERAQHRMARVDPLTGLEMRALDREQRAVKDARAA
jgi:hypothetical protein